MESLYDTPVVPNPAQSAPAPSPAPFVPPPDPLPSPNRPRIWVSILATMIVLLLAAGVGFMLGREHPDESLLVPVATATPIPSGPSSTPTPPPSTGMKFDGEFMTFVAPSDWKPADIEMAWGEVNEKVSLGVPLFTGDQYAVFTPVAAPEKPTYVFEESSIMIGGVDSYKWKGRGDTFVSYDYVTKNPTKNGLFTLHVTTQKNDPVLEQQLDDLVKTIVFKPE